MMYRSSCTAYVHTHVHRHRHAFMLSHQLSQFRLFTGQLTHTHRAHFGRVTCVTQHPMTHHVYSGAHDHSILIWKAKDVRTEEEGSAERGAVEGDADGRVIWEEDDESDTEQEHAATGTALMDDSELPALERLSR